MLNYFNALKDKHMYSKLLKYVNEILSKAKNEKHSHDILGLLKNYVLLSYVRGSYIICNIFLKHYTGNFLYSAMFGNFVNRFLLEIYINLQVVHTIKEVKNKDFKYINKYWLYEQYKGTTDRDVILECLSRMAFYELIKFKVANYREKDITKCYVDEEITEYLSKDLNVIKFLEVVFGFKNKNEQKEIIGEFYKKRKKGWDGTSFADKVKFLKESEKYLKNSDICWTNNLYEKYCNQVHGNVIYTTDVQLINKDKVHKYYRKESKRHLIVSYILLASILSFYDKFCNDGKNSDKIDKFLKYMKRNNR